MFCICYTLLILCFFYWNKIIWYFYTIAFSVRVIYNIDWDFFIEHYISEGSILFMEGENSGEHKFKKPAFPHSQGYKAEESSTGGKRELTDSGSTEFPSFTKDDGTKTLSREPRDWGFDSKHNYDTANYKTNCWQMANLLDYHNKVHNQSLVNGIYDKNPYLNESGNEFFESFTESRNIASKEGTDQIANTAYLRNLFRNAGR